MVNGIIHVELEVSDNDTVGEVLYGSFNDLNRPDLKNVKIKDLIKTDLKLVLEHAFYEDLWNGDGVDVIGVTIPKQK
jgi:hypothetical protein